MMTSPVNCQTSRWALGPERANSWTLWSSSTLNSGKSRSQLFSSLFFLTWQHVSPVSSRVHREPLHWWGNKPFPPPSWAEAPAHGAHLHWSSKGTRSQWHRRPMTTVTTDKAHGSRMCPGQGNLARLLSWCQWGWDTREATSGFLLQSTCFRRNLNGTCQESRKTKKRKKQTPNTITNNPKKSRK